MPELKLIEYGTDAYQLMVNFRNRVLLKPIGIGSGFIQQENEKADFFIGAFAGPHLKGCCILSPVEPKTVQLRQMAVEPEIQKSGLGRSILQYAEELAIRSGFVKVVLHAREGVLPFYEKAGYRIAGPPFMEVGITHFKMEKSLSPETTSDPSL